MAVEEPDKRTGVVVPVLAPWTPHGWLWSVAAALRHPVSG
jgi:hypothetical protein